MDGLTQELEQLPPQAEPEVPVRVRSSLHIRSTHYDPNWIGDPFRQRNVFNVVQTFTGLRPRSMALARILEQGR
jgi:hypothetical protein